MHPVLAALFLVLEDDEDLGNINRDHPGIFGFKYYDRNAVFPETLTMPSEGPAHWWEELGASNIISFLRCYSYLFEKLKRLDNRWF
jgi:hypothetical protein